jgi:hypothetical protein
MVAAPIAWRRQYVDPRPMGFLGFVLTLSTIERPVNLVVFSSLEIREKLKEGNVSLNAFQAGKMTLLIGDEHEFRDLL